MKTNSAFYETTNAKKSSHINITSLFSWIAVFAILVMFWSGISVVYKKDYVPHAIAKIEHKERKFLATHKAIQKRLTGIRSVV